MVKSFENVYVSAPLKWRHNERDGVSNQTQINENKSMLLVIGLCVGNPRVTGGFSSKRASNEFFHINISIQTGHEQAAWSIISKIV